ncbi:DUF2589 domain-containing protein [Eubacterium sp.]|uniref:DUF2589 domain-containing protein n=1 Tax=Eubacterium sp. TaxID=142586 RepID=UPI0026DF69A2|nr:DUF2589 domain-containing protein [Eubacterium sp.]MDO5432592.1 DUF2589 domain-containing protein [Eubacterium sp.]
MPEGLVSMQDQFSGLDMAALIGGPLKAACDAQMMLANSTAKFIEDVGLEPAEDGSRKVRTTSFSFTRAATAPDGSSIGSEEVMMNIPFLSIIKIPTLMVNDVDITFDMEVKSSTSSESTSDKKGELEANAGLKIGPFHMDVKIKGSIACHESNTRSSDNSAKYHVEVHARDSAMPEGLARMLDILATASAPVAIEQKQVEAPQNPEIPLPPKPEKPDQPTES